MYISDKAARDSIFQKQNNSPDQHGNFSTLHINLKSKCLSSPQRHGEHKGTRD